MLVGGTKVQKSDKSERRSVRGAMRQWVGGRPSGREVSMRRNGGPRRRSVGEGAMRRRVGWRPSGCEVSRCRGPQFVQTCVRSAGFGTKQGCTASQGSTSQTSAGRSFAPLAEGCNSREFVAGPSARLRAELDMRALARRAAASPREGPQLAQGSCSPFASCGSEHAVRRRSARQPAAPAQPLPPPSASGWKTSVRRSLLPPMSLAGICEKTARRCGRPFVPTGPVYL